MNLPRIPQFVPVRPVLMLTGFLGAGKTTLLRELLIATRDAELRSDVILNDYADANVDSATLRDFAQNIEPLTATCACCEGLDFLLDLSMKSVRSKSDLLFIELNGTADPVPIVETFTLLENKLQLHPRWQVCVIDVRRFGSRGGYKDIELLQLQTASHIYLSHTDAESSYETIIQEIRRTNSSASIVQKQELIEMVIALGKGNDRLLVDEENACVGTNVHGLKKSEEHYKTHEFTSCQILLPQEEEEGRIREWLASLSKEVIRAKVLIGISGKSDCRYLFERVGMEVLNHTQRVSLNNNVPNSAIFIGPDLNPDVLLEQTESYLNGEF